MDKDVNADGLRGLAAANVVLCHLLISIFPLGFEHLWPGSGVSTQDVGVAERVVSFPLVSLLWNGNFPVCIFFVLSGYVLSARFWVRGDLSDLATKALRRFFRLAIPVFGSVLFAFALMSCGSTAWRRAAELTGSTWLGQFWIVRPVVLDALKDGLYRAILSGNSAYVPVLWTMKIELLGSFLVFGYAALAPPRWRGVAFFLTVTLAVAAISPESWPLYVGFLAGVHIGRMTLPQPRACVAVAVLTSLFFGAFDTSGIYTWTSVISADFFWRKHLFNILGGICLVYAVRAGFGASILSTAPVQYLGRISYGLYLVHFPLVLTVLSGTYVALVDGLGWPRWAAAGTAIPLTFVVACAVATVFQKTFDSWGIALSRSMFPSRVSRAAALAER